MTIALRQACSVLAISEMAILSGIFCSGLIGTADKWKPLVAYPIIVVLGLVGLVVRAYDHGVYSAACHFLPTVHLVEDHR